MASTVLLTDPAIPFGSWVLVTGVNGLIGSHIADQFLAAGFHVRGTVRNLKKAEWMVTFFEARYSGHDVRFELCEVIDMSIEGSFDDAVKDCAGVVHTTSSVDLQATTPEPTISNNITTVMTCLRSAAREPGVQRFVLTSSAWAISAPRPNVNFVVDPKDWNEEAIERAYAKNAPLNNGMNIFMAGKTLAERECWNFVKEHNPNFAFTSVLPDTVFGSVLSPQYQGIPSTAGFLRMLFEGQGLDFLPMIAPQYHCDCVDVGKLHVAALIHPAAVTKGYLAMQIGGTGTICWGCFESGFLIESFRKTWI